MPLKTRQGRRKEEASVIKEEKADEVATSVDTKDDDGVSSKPNEDNEASKPKNDDEASEPNEEIEVPVKKADAAADSVLNETLIDIVREHHELWNPEDSKYKLKMDKPRIWNNIAKVLNETLAVSVDGDFVQTRWKNLRDSFVRIKRRRRTATGLEAGDAPEMWPHFNSMTFIDSTTASNSARTSNLVPSTFTPREVKEEEDNSMKTTLVEKPLKPPRRAKPEVSSSSESNEPAHKKPKLSLVSMAQKLLEDDSKEKIDDWAVFGEFAASTLRSLHGTEPKLAKKTKLLIQKALLEAESKQAGI